MDFQHQNMKQRVKIKTPMVDNPDGPNWEKNNVSDWRDSLYVKNKIYYEKWATFGDDRGS